MDLLTSGPERPRRVRRIWRRRGARLAAAVLVAAAAVVLLRSTVDSSPSGRSGVPPTVAAGPTVPLPPRPTSPYDRLPGRTPIPAPAQTRDGVSGPLPPVGGPDKRAAGVAVGLVLGRYCFEPRRYAFTLEPDHDGARRDWRHVDVLVFRLDGGGAGPYQRLFLDWTGRSYRWLAVLNLLQRC